VLIEGGARVAESFLAAGLVERYHEFRGLHRLGSGSVPGPANAPRDGQNGWRLASTTETGTDMYRIWERVAAFDAMLEAA
jgi:diaminohydroxyphosphoribosylaminopyrimidine deaminase/5-amino-6-(5-phosphoribosylamino)uracil reductase